jgi:ATP-dependent DNA ligase
MDSSRINLEFADGKFVSATTRNGSVLSISCFDNLTLPNKDRFILDGELMWLHQNGTVAERKVSNGYVTKAVRGTITSEEELGLYVVVWDYIPYEDFLKEVSKIPYSQRLATLQELSTSFDNKLQLVETEIVNSREEVMEKYQRNLDRGEEGCILKSINGIWEAKRSKYQLKLKAEDPADLLVVGYTLGTPGTQFDGMLGSLICQTLCGQLEVNVGSGFKHKQGERDNPESYVGKIIQVKYNCIISSRGSDKKSLFLPIYDGIRDDKTTANSLEDLL